MKASIFASVDNLTAHFSTLSRSWCIYLCNEWCDEDKENVIDEQGTEKYGDDFQAWQPKSFEHIDAKNDSEEILEDPSPTGFAIDSPDYDN